MGAGRLAFLCLFGLALVLTEVSGQGECSVPGWPTGFGQSPIDQYRGKVLLVALLKGTCPYCVQQATLLERVKDYMVSHGWVDLAMIIVNAGDRASRLAIGNLQSATNLTIYQDNENGTLFELFDGGKDDFVVYDRCGQRTTLIPYPHSDLRHRSSTTMTVLMVISRARHHCYCSLDYPRLEHMPQLRRSRRPRSVSQSEQALAAPGGGGLLGQISGAENVGVDVRLHCAEGDRNCQRRRRHRNGRVRGLRRRLRHRGSHRRARPGTGRRHGRRRGRVGRVRPRGPRVRGRGREARVDGAAL